MGENALRLLPAAPVSLGVLMTAEQIHAANNTRTRARERAA